MHYIKKLGFQELGSPKKDGSVSRGRYFLISKSVDEHAFFPHLSKTEFNDTVLIAIIPPNSNKKVWCSYVYHNDKYHGSTASNPRDEYRLYLNLEIDPDRAFFKPGQIAVFTKLDLNDGDEHEDFLYRLNVFDPDSDEYAFLDEILAAKNSNHYVYQEELGFINIQDSEEIQNLEVEIPEETTKVVIKKLKSPVYNELEEELGAHLFNSTSFRDFVLHSYQYKCAITGERIKYKSLINLEAAHIKPKAQNGTYLPSNGIAMSRDIHWAFDKGMFYISEDFKVVVHPEVKDTKLNEYDDSQVSVPDNDFYQPNKSFLEHHKKHVYGLFLYSGVIKALEEIQQ